MADTEDGYSYEKVYDPSTDKTWGFDGNECDLKNLDKNYKHDVLEQAQKFTNPHLYQDECQQIAKDLYRKVDLDGNGLIEQCEAAKQYVAFGNDPSEFKQVRVEDMPIKGYDYSKLDTFCKKKFK